MKKTISILGSTGSIGSTALKIIGDNDDFSIYGLCAHSNVSLLIEQIKKHKPKVACLTSGYSKELCENANGAELFFGEDAYKHCINRNSCDVALLAMVGISGLPSLMECIKNNIQVALANKEALVCGGKIITDALNKKNAKLIPVDSELSALFQCLGGHDLTGVSRLILTASGGPFRTWKKEDIYSATLAQALKHPNWSMGKKITVDCATMINKGFEVIETHHLFGIETSKIDVIIHPQSIIHSMVEYTNSAVLAHLSPTNMAHAVQYAFSYPEKIASCCGYLDFTKMQNLTFEPPDTEKFPGLKLAVDCLKTSQTACIVLNSANEVAVEKFLIGEIVFGEIYEKIVVALEKHSHLTCENIENVYEIDRITREFMYNNN